MYESGADEDIDKMQDSISTQEDITQTTIIVRKEATQISINIHSLFGFRYYTFLTLCCSKKDVVVVIVVVVAFQNEKCRGIHCAPRKR